MVYDLIAYVDDLRAIVSSMEHAWSIARRVASRLERVGIQDTTSNRRTDNGLWAGGMYDTLNKEITKTVRQENRPKEEVMYCSCRQR